MIIELEKEKERWKAIKGYEGLYQISSFGRVKSIWSNHRIKKIRIYKNGRLEITDSDPPEITMSCLPDAISKKALERAWDADAHAEEVV